MRLHSAVLLGIVLINCALLGRGAVVYDEAVQGDLSNSGLAPTVITVAAGSNQIFGTTGITSAGVDRDYFTFNVPVGLQLSSIVELAGTRAGSSGEIAVSFIGMQAGKQVTVPPNTSTAAGLMGWVHYSGTNTDYNILPTMSRPAYGSSGFTVPLGAGDYSFWIQEYNTSPVPYRFDFVLAPVSSSAPEPATCAMMMAGLGVLTVMVRRLKFN